MCRNWRFAKGRLIEQIYFIWSLYFLHTDDPVKHTQCRSFLTYVTLDMSLWCDLWTLTPHDLELGVMHLEDGFMFLPWAKADLIKRQKGFYYHHITIVWNPTILCFRNTNLWNTMWRVCVRVCLCGRAGVVYGFFSPRLMGFLIGLILLNSFLWTHVHIFSFNDNRGIVQVFYVRVWRCSAMLSVFHLRSHAFSFIIEPF